MIATTAWARDALPTSPREPASTTAPSATGRVRRQRCSSRDGLPPRRATTPRHVARSVRPDLVPGLPTPTTGIGLQALRGAAARVAPDATAFLHRSPRHDLLVLAQWPDPADDERVVGWTRTAYEALRPNLDVAVYVNNLGVEGRDQVRAAFGANHDRLVALKRRLDPGNVFRLNQNVAP